MIPYRTVWGRGGGPDLKGTWDFGQILKGTCKIVDLSAAGEKILKGTCKNSGLSAAGEKKHGFEL